MKQEELKTGEIVLYKASDGSTEIDVKFENNTIRLPQKKIAELFGVDRSVITKHLRNIFKTWELSQNSVSAKFAHTAEDGKKYTTQFYNLDTIISVWYRVNSIQATHFRIWATEKLRDYLLKWYSLNQKRLEETKLNELEQVVALIKKNLVHWELSHKELSGLLEVATQYTHSRILLQKYDEWTLELPTMHNETKADITYQEAIKSINDMKSNFLFSEYVSELFGIERNNEFKGILESIYQRFEGQELYPSVEEKAAHLLFFIVKDHPFCDGNKKIGAFLFLWFLAKNNCLYTADGAKKIDDATLVAITLLVATCDNNQKDMIIKLILNFIAK